MTRSYENSCLLCCDTKKIKIPVDCSICNGKGLHKYNFIRNTQHCFSCNGTGKNNEFLSLPVDNILISTFAVHAFEGFKIADIVDCKKEALFNTAKSNIWENLKNFKEKTVNYWALKAIDHLERILSEYGLKLKE